MTIEQINIDPQLFWRDFLYDKNGAVKSKLRRFVRLVEPEFSLEDVASEAYIRLSVRPFQVKHSTNLDAYAKVVFKSVVHDIFRKKYGRPRPPSWVNDWKPIYRAVWRDLLLSGLSMEDLVLRYQDRLSRDELRTFITALNRSNPLWKDWHAGMNHVSIDTDNESALIAEGFPHVEDNISNNLNDVQLLTIMNWLLSDDRRDLPPLVGQSALATKNDLGLSDLDRMILRMHYFDEMGLEEIAQSLKIPRHTVRNARNISLNKIKKAINRAMKYGKYSPGLER